jgi:type IV pilus assembly protein PilV
MPLMYRSHRAFPRRLGGVALIEILVAILLFALGVLALVGLQGSLTRAQTAAKVRTDAAALASEVIGQMWGDLANLSAYSGTSCASHARCKEWQNKVATALPSGASTITVTGGDVQVNLRWAMPNGKSHQYTTNTSIDGGN